MEKDKFALLKDDLIKRGFLTAVENVALKTPLEKYEYVLRVIRLMPSLRNLPTISPLLRELRNECLKSGITQVQLNESIRNILLSQSDCVPADY